MGNPQNDLVLEGVMFFGRVSASISHEIKNVLAVMSESAGLIEDLCLLSIKRGVGLDVQRVQSLSGRIRSQVGRADEIVKNMNRFAHTVDEVISTIDLQDHIQLLITLSRRLAAMREVSIEFVPIEGQIRLTTSPFLLLCLLWSCLHYSMAVCGAEKKVCIGVRESDAGVRISFSGLKDLSGSADGGLPADLEKISARELRARLSADSEAGVVTVELPWKISADPNS